MIRPRLATLVIVFVAGLGLAACSSGESVSEDTTTTKADTTSTPTKEPSQATNDVAAKDNFFDPDQPEVKAGTKLTVTNEGNNRHTFTADDGSFDSGVLTPGKTFELTAPDKAGGIKFHCEIHANMTGTLEVAAG